MRQLKSYRAKTHSIANSQILFEDYAYEDALVVLMENDLADFHRDVRIT